MREFYVLIDPGSRSVSFDDEVSIDQLAVQYLTVARSLVAEELMRSLHDRMRDTGRHSGALLVGWRAWLQLCFELSGRKMDPVSTFHGVPIFVDESSPDTIRTLPNTERVRITEEMARQVK